MTKIKLKILLTFLAFVCLIFEGCGDGQTPPPGTQKNYITIESLIPPNNDGDFYVTVKAGWVNTSTSSSETWLEIWKTNQPTCIYTTSPRQPIQKNGTYTFSLNMNNLATCFDPGDYTVKAYVDGLGGADPPLEPTAFFTWQGTPSIGALLVEKARNMQYGFHQFYEPPHIFNGNTLNNLTTNTAGWSYTSDVMTSNNYTTRLTNAWTTNQTNWLGYDCPGTSQDNGFPYTNSASSYHTWYDHTDCNAGFSCFTFVYEVGVLAGINFGSWTPGIAGDFITQFGSISVSERKVGDLVCYDFQNSTGFNDHVAIITQVNSTDPREDMVIGAFGAHEFFKYGVGECKTWGFHSWLNALPPPSTTKGLFKPLSQGGYWQSNWDTWDYPDDIRIVRITGE